MATKPAQDIQVGDVIVFGGYHRVDRIDPPTATTLAILPSCLGYARSDNGWGITLVAGATTIDVV